MNKTRQLYQLITQGRRLSESEETEIIENGNAVKTFNDSRTRKILDNWIARQREAQHDYMRVEIGSLTGLNIVKWFNAFLKYTYLVQEDRAYRKLEAFFRTTVEQGEKYEEIRRRRSERAAKSTDSK